MLTVVLIMAAAVRMTESTRDDRRRNRAFAFSWDFVWVVFMSLHVTRVKQREQIISSAKKMMKAERASVPRIWGMWYAAYKGENQSQLSAPLDQTKSAMIKLATMTASQDQGRFEESACETVR